jgi:hypothetical protein
LFQERALTGFNAWLGRGHALHDLWKGLIDNDRRKTRFLRGILRCGEAQQYGGGDEHRRHGKSF